MKYFRLARKSFRKYTDLRDFESDIKKAVNKVNPLATVYVEKEYYTTEPTLTKRESIAVSTILRNGKLNTYSVDRPCLFLSVSRLPNSKKTQRRNENAR